MHHIDLGTIDYAILVVYTLFVLGIGFALKRFTRSSTDFFLSGRSIPAWVAALAFISANLGAQEVIGMGACGAKYGMLTCHFYFAAIPAMVFVGLFMMPFYYGSKARSVPEYLKLRFDEKTRGLNAISFAVMTIMSSGISMYALAKLLGVLVGWNFNFSLLVSAAIVLVYVFLGGLTSAIYNEVLQFCLIVAGFAPLAWLGYRDAGGWSGLAGRLAALAQVHGPQHAPTIHACASMASPDLNSMHIGWFGMVMGLWFVLGFGYWCTDFLVVQRAMAAESMSAARRTPLIACIPKMFIPVLVILPGMIAIVTVPRAIQSAAPSGSPRGLVHFSATERSPASQPEPENMDLSPSSPGAAAAGQGLIPPKLHDERQADGQVVRVPEIDAQTGQPVLDYDMAIPMMLTHYLPSGLLGLGLTALMASFMSGMAGNVTAFNTVWTYDIYQSYLAPGRSDAHYLWMGRMATIAGVAVSIAAAYVATYFNNIMDLLQLVFGFVNAPLFATFLLGMFWKRTTGHGAFFGLLSGTLAAAVHQGLTLPKGGWLAALLHIGPLRDYQVDMAQNFWTAIYAWTTCFVATIAISLLTRRRKSDEDLRGLVYSLTPRPKPDDHLAWYARPMFLATVVLAATVVLYVIFW